MTTTALEPFGVALVPGRFDASDDAWVRHIQAAADDTIRLPDGTEVPVCKIVVTETTDRNLPDEACPDGWKWHRLWRPYGASNVSTLLRKSRFQTHPMGHYAELLTDDPIWTAKGRLRPPYYALVVPDIDRVTGHLSMTAGAHQPLMNTERRKAAHDEAIEGTGKVWAKGRAVLGGGAVRLLAADWNVSVQNKENATEWRSQFPGFTPTWAVDDDVPGWRRLIDFQAGGQGLVHLETEWHQRPNSDEFDHPWQCTAWGYRRPWEAPPVVPQPVLHTGPCCDTEHLGVLGR